MTKTKTFQKKSKMNISVILCFVIIFVYGSLLLMVGYTQAGLANVMFPPHHTSYIVYLLLAQSLGLIASTLLLSKLLAKMNIKYIFMAGMMGAAIMLTLISQIDKLSSNHIVLISLFIIFSFILGIGIGPVSPLISTYLSAIYSGNKRTTMLSVSNGVYGIGAGIIPLVASAAIIKLGGEGFNAVRFFYYIAIVLAVLAAVAGYFVDYRHSAQSTSSKIIGKDNKGFNIWKPLMFAVAIMSAYMICETIANYMFVNVATDTAGTITKQNVKIHAIQGFGLFVMVQGLWRTFSGLFVTPHVKKRYFILASALIMLAGFSWIFFGGLRHTYGVYAIAILFGLGIGNLWPAIYSYAIDIDERRASYIGMVINITSMVWIPLTQLVVALIWTAHGTETSGILYYSPILLGMVASAAVIAFLLLSLPLHAHLKRHYKDVVTRKK